jgi:opacity protein-like surface antigen
MKTTRLFLIVMVLICISSGRSISQDADLIKYFENFSIGAYVDAYYSFDTDKNIFNTPRLFCTTSPYREMVGLNIAQVSLKYNSDIVRGIITMQYGDIPEADYAPVTRSKYIQEAYIGFSPTKNFWIDGGYFFTHIGTENIPKNNIISSFSLQGNFEPLFQSGVRIGYDFSDKAGASLYLLNGYNLFEDNNKNKSFGLQFYYAPDPVVKFVYNNIAGNEQTDGKRGKTRFLNNFIVYLYPTDKTDIIASGDYGTQELSKISDTSQTANFYGLSLTARYRFTPKYSASIRGDFFQDLDATVTPLLNNGTGIKANALTVGLEYKPLEKAYVRLEYRYVRMDAAQTIFYDNSNIRNEATVSMGFEY